MTVQVFLSRWTETSRRGGRWLVPELATVGESYTVIDLRPDKAATDGFCLFARTDGGAPSSAGRTLVPIGSAGRNIGDSIGPVARRLLGNLLDLDLGAGAKIPTLLAAILHDGPLGGRINGGRALLIPTLARRWQAYIGGELVHDLPVVAGGATESFTYSDGALATVGSANWANVVGTVQVRSNAAENNAAFGFDVARHLTAMADGNHYAQAVASTLTGSSGDYNFLGVRIRQAAAANDAIHFEAGWAAGTSQSELNLLVFTSGTPSAIANWISTDQVTGYPMPARPFTFKVQGNGSSLSCWAGSYGPLTATDGTYSTQTYTGVMAYTENGGTSLARLDDFESGGLGQTISGTTISATSSVATAGAVSNRGPYIAAVGTLYETGGSTGQVTIPAGYATGEMLFMVIVGRASGSAGSNDSISVDQSWQLLGSRIRFEVGTYDLLAEVWYKVAASASETNPTVSVGTAIALSSSNRGWIAAIARCKNVDTTDPFDSVSAVTASAAAAATYQPTGLSTNTDNDLMVSVAGTADDNALALNTTNGFYLDAGGTSYDSTVGTDMALGIASKVVVSHGAATNPTWSQGANGNDAWVAITFALKEFQNVQTIVAATTSATSSIVAGSVAGTSGTTAAPIAAATAQSVTSIVAGNVAGTSGTTAAPIGGATASVTSSVVAGAVSPAGAAPVPAGTITATSSVVAGTVSASGAGTVAAATPTATTSIVAGTVAGSGASTIGSVVVSVGTSVVAGTVAPASAAPIAATTVTATASVVAGTATGAGTASIAGATVETAATIVQGAVAGSGAVNIAGVILGASTSIVAGAAGVSGAAPIAATTVTASTSVVAGSVAPSSAVTIDATTITATTSIAAGAVAPSSAATIEAATVTATTSIDAGSVLGAGSLIDGATATATSSVVPGALTAAGVAPIAAAVTESATSVVAGNVSGSGAVPIAGVVTQSVTSIVAGAVTYGNQYIGSVVIAVGTSIATGAASGSGAASIDVIIVTITTAVVAASVTPTGAALIGDGTPTAMTSITAGPFAGAGNADIAAALVLVTAIVQAGALIGGEVAFTWPIARAVAEAIAARAEAESTYVVADSVGTFTATAEAE